MSMKKSTTSFYMEKNHNLKSLNQFSNLSYPPSHRTLIYFLLRLVRTLTLTLIPIKCINHIPRTINFNPSTEETKHD